jgi:hypothetical protein
VVNDCGLTPPDCGQPPTQLMSCMHVFILHNMIIEDENDEDLPILNVANSSQSKLRCGFIFNDFQVGTPNLHDLKHTII